MIAIAALDALDGIGREGALLAPLSADLKRFKSLTMGKVLIYGRKTLDTFPGKRVLPGRVNLILSSGLKQGDIPGGEIAANIDELKKCLDELKNEGYQEDDFCLIGGASVYRQLLPLCKRVWVTRIHAVFAADAFFPNLIKSGFTLGKKGRLLREGPWLFSYEEWIREE